MDRQGDAQSVRGVLLQADPCQARPD